MFVNGLVGGFARPEKLAGVPVESLDDSGLANRQQRLPRMIVDVDIDQYLLEDVIEVPIIARQELVVPDDLPGIRIERQR